MIEIQDKSRCSGCGACSQICAKHAIRMVEDEQGFLYPETNCEECVDCGLCEKVCPMQNHADPKQPQLVLAAKNRNNEIRRMSSSGGIFTLLAEYIITQGGVVFGAAFDDKWNVRHTYIETIEGIASIRGSKYVQSVIGDTFKEAKQFLNQGRKVLFTGTPCQILGLKNYLRKDYENLLTMEVFCHGVPSPQIWREYLQEVIRPKGVAGKNTVLSSLNAMPVITGISFRDKRLGWKKYGFVVRGKVAGGDKNSVSPSVDADQLLIEQEAFKNPYLSCFISNVYLRPSCHACMAKSGKSGADIALADFWGIDKHCHSFSDNLGVTLLYAVSAKAAEIVRGLNIEFKELDPSKYLSYNTAYCKPAVKSKYSDLFWTIYKEEGIHALFTVSEKIKSSIGQRILTQLKTIVKRIILR